MLEVDTLGGLFNNIDSKSCLHGVQRRVSDAIITCETDNEEVRDSFVLEEFNNIMAHPSALTIEVAESISEDRVHLALFVHTLLNNEIDFLLLKIINKGGSFGALHAMRRPKPLLHYLILSALDPVLQFNEALERLVIWWMVVGSEGNMVSWMEVLCSNLDDKSGQRNK